MKMHGLGNDFVIVDARAHPVQITPALARGIGHRQFGVGFDQLAVIENGESDAHLVFYNADGSVSATCRRALSMCSRRTTSVRMWASNCWIWARPLDFAR